MIFFKFLNFPLKSTEIPVGLRFQLASVTINFTDNRDYRAVLYSMIDIQCFQNQRRSHLLDDFNVELWPQLVVGLMGRYIYLDLPKTNVLIINSSCLPRCVNGDRRERLDPLSGRGAQPPSSLLPG